MERWDEAHPTLATVSSVTFSALAGATCWLPLIGAVLGMAALAIGMWFEATQPFAPPIAAVLFVAGVVLERCSPCAE